MPSYLHSHCCCFTISANQITRFHNPYCSSSDPGSPLAKMIVKEGSLQMLRAVFHAFPTRTPNRLHHISQCISCQTWDEGGKDVIINAHDNYSRTLFSASSADHIISLDKYFGPPESQHINEPETPIILVPTMLFCCEKAIIIDSRAADMMIYTDNAVREAKSFHGCCKKCGMTFYSGFSHDKKLNLRTFSEDSKFFIYGSGVGFSVNLLQKTT